MHARRAVTSAALLVRSHADSRTRGPLHSHEAGRRPWRASSRCRGRRKRSTRPKRFVPICSETLYGEPESGGAIAGGALLSRERVLRRGAGIALEVAAEHGADAAQDAIRGSAALRRGYAAPFSPGRMAREHRRAGRAGSTRRGVEATPGAGGLRPRRCDRAPRQARSKTDDSSRVARRAPRSCAKRSTAALAAGSRPRPGSGALARSLGAGCLLRQ